VAKYRFLAYDASGNRVSAMMEATSPENVKQLLWADGLFIVNIRPRRLFSIPPLEELFPSLIKVRRTELILFSRQLATFVQVGVPMLEGLAVLRDQAASRLMKKALTDIISDITTGLSLSGAMSRLPTVFPPLYVQMIRTAEVSGNLDEVLRQLATYMARDESSIKKIRSAMIYPAIVISLAVGVITLLVTFVLPAFSNLFLEFNAQMPPPTRFLLWVSGFTQEFRFEILATLGLLIGGGLVYSQTPSGKTAIDTLLLRIPVIGTVVRFAIIERYLRTLATLARSGVPIAQMLETASRSVGNIVFARGLAAVRPRMLSGDGFAGPLAATHLFPQMVIQMVKVGEETGHLDANLESAADHFGEEVDYRLKKAITFLEPALVIAVGVVVGFIAISVIAPMYGLVRAIK
jgi:type IV pilus assembly protein PilC